VGVAVWADAGRGARRHDARRRPWSRLDGRFIFSRSLSKTDVRWNSNGPPG
jgi:hypothetical protein